MNFQQWLFKELDDRGWSQAELARRAKVSRAAISNVLSNTRQPGPDLCEAISRAFHVPADLVFQMAGILPPISPRDARIEEIAEIYSRLESEADKQEILEQSRLRLRIQEERAKYAKRPPT